MLVALAALWRLCAQPPSRPPPVSRWAIRAVTTPKTTTSSQSFELGYRFATIGGDVDMYRSTVELRRRHPPAVQLAFHPIPRRPRHTGSIRFSSTPRAWATIRISSRSLRIEKNDLYRYDMIWRQNDFLRSGADRSPWGEHFENTTRTMQDHDLTLFPQGNFKFFLGYSRNVDGRPGALHHSALRLSRRRISRFSPIFTSIRTNTGWAARSRFFGFRLNVLHGWEDFKQDTPTSILARRAWAIIRPTPKTLNSFQSSQPYHGTSPYWRVGLFRDEGARVGRSTDASATSRASAISSTMNSRAGSLPSARP